MKTIAITILGNINHKCSFKSIQRWSSNLFRISGISTCINIPDGKDDWQKFDDKDFKFVQPIDNADITVAVTEYQLQDNYFVRRLPNGVIALSFYEVADILERENIPLENFVIRNLYEFCLLLHLYTNIPPTAEKIPDIFHDETSTTAPDKLMMCRGVCR